MKKILCLGHILHDMRCYIKEFPDKDKTAIIKYIFYSTGGSATNTGIDFSMLGMESRVIGTIGNDDNGSFILNNLKSFKVDTKYINIKKGTTGQSVIIINHKGNVKIFEYLGTANRPITPHDKMFKGISHFHISGYELNTIKKFINKSKDVSLSFDPGRSISHLGHRKLNDILKRTDYLFVNKREIIELYPSINITNSIVQLSKRYKINIAVKRGKQGALAYDYEKKQMYNIKGHNVKSVDTIGAGDSFNAGVIFYLLRGESFQDAVEFGNKVAAINVTIKGTHTIPVWKNVDNILNKIRK
ncbi:carbohydrate kinase family protein [Candidatus Micrarchaeota archaeon]|nr:carbohydrate kinase family protein [Candidatus Micrarchaeota archaeon]